MVKIGNKQLNILWIRGIVYTCFFLSGFTSLIFEILWSRQFVTVFGNSSYAISVVLCAYMAGLGLGSIFGGRLADRTRNRAGIYSTVLASIAIWAFLIPSMLNWLRSLVPTLTSLSPSYLLVSSLMRFGLSFAILGVPCFLMGTTLPLLGRTVTESSQSIGLRIGMLYSLNTLGASLGVMIAGFWMVDLIGLHNMNLVAIGVNIVLAVVILVLSKFINLLASSDLTKTDKPKSVLEKRETRYPVYNVPGWLLLALAFFNGMVGLASEVLWIRFISFQKSLAYVFPNILFIYLLGIGLGGLIYRLLVIRFHRSIKVLGLVEIMLALSIPTTFIISALIYATGPPDPLGVKGMSFITMFIPTVLMGIVFPLLCAIYGSNLETLGRSIGKLYATNTAGTVLGALLPIFVLIPLFGIQLSLFFISLIAGVIGLSLLAYSVGSNKRFKVGLAVIYTLVLFLFFTVVPSNLCQRVFLASSYDLAKHTDILFYREGRTGTAIVTRDRINKCKNVYINGMNEVPVLYAHELCFKMMGDLAPMLHPNPEDVLIICFGGGIAAGATSCIPEVKSLTVVDLEKSVVEAAEFLSEENNGLLGNPKVDVIIDDGRNYLMLARQKWPVIVSDATHPKSSDSWVLYTREFYRLVHEHLTDDGVFVQWLPIHGLSSAEVKIILRTFQSEFPHTSLWFTSGVDEVMKIGLYLLLVATQKPLEINVAMLQDRLSTEIVCKDLEPYGLHTTAGFLNTFLCAEGKLRQWVGEGPVNTDNLPYTQYKTRYSGANFSSMELIEVMEDVWPYLIEMGSQQVSKQLREELIVYTKVNRLVLSGRIVEACYLFPNDIRYRQMLRICEEWSDYIQALIEIYWDDPQFLILFAQKSLSHPNGRKAVIPIYKRVLELQPNNMIALIMLGTSHMREGNLQASEEYLRRAVHLNPNNAKARYNLSLVLEQTGREAEALQHLRKAALNSDFEDAPARLGFHLLRKRQVSEAIPWLRRAVEINPVSVQNRFNLAIALLNTGKMQEALSQLYCILKIDPDNKNVLNILAKIEEQKRTHFGISVDTTKPN